MTAFGPAAVAAAELPLAGDAAALAALARNSVVAGVERQVLHIRLGRLASGLQHEHHHRLLREALAPMLRPSRARLFALPNGDLVAAAPPGGGHLETVATMLGTLFAGAAQRAVALLRLPEQAAALMVTIEAAVAPVAPPPLPPCGAALTATDAAALERAVGTASLAAHLRCRPVMRITPTCGAPELQWTEWRLALPTLCAALLPGLDLRAEPALARWLRGLLDRRLLAELARPEEVRRLGHAGLAVGLACLATPEFQRLDGALDQPGRARLVLGFAAEEVLADPEGFLAAREVCRARGYRLALELEDAATLALLPPERLGVDLVRLPWTPGLEARAMAAAVPPERLVLAAVDRAAGIAWGWEAGITLFEGPLLRG